MQTHNFSALTANHFGQSVCGHWTTPLRGKSKPAANIGLNKKTSLTLQTLAVILTEFSPSIYFNKSLLKQNEN